MANGLGGWLFGKPEQQQWIQQMQPNQAAFGNRALGLADQGMGDYYRQMMGNPYEGFEPMAQEARTNFSQQTVPGLAERFTSMGGQRSSAFPQQLGVAGANLNQGLASMKSQYGMQRMGQQGNFMNQLMGIGMQPQGENVIRPGTTGSLADIIKILASLYMA